MIAAPITKPKGIAVRGLPHVVEVDGDDFVARCGARWPRKADGEVLPDHYNGERCEPCR